MIGGVKDTMDQATILRDLMVRRQGGPEITPPSSRTARTIAITSGKGGVGKSNIALNLAIALAELDARVSLLDANLGLGNIDLLCGLNGYWNLSHVVSGARTLSDVILKGPAGISVIPGASGLTDIADCPDLAQQDILYQMDELELAHDFLIVDTGAGIHRTVRQFAGAADLVLIVTTPEPTAIADAYATIKAYCALAEGPQLEVLVNQAESASQARAILLRLQQTSRMFLKADVGLSGLIPRDPAVVRSVALRRPFLLTAPHSPASKQIRRLAQQLKGLGQGPPKRSGFFEKLWHRLAHKVAEPTGSSSLTATSATRTHITSAAARDSLRF